MDMSEFVKIEKYSISKVDKTPTVKIHIYNNQKNTNTAIIKFSNAMSEKLNIKKGDKLQFFYKKTDKKHIFLKSAEYGYTLTANKKHSGVYITMSLKHLDDIKDTLISYKNKIIEKYEIADGGIHLYLD